MTRAVATRAVATRAVAARLLAAAAVAVVAVTGAAATDAGPTGSFQAPAADWLFVQSADTVTFDGTTLTLKGIHPATVLFTDRPQRMAGGMATAEFVSTWAAGKDSFLKDPPNASLSSVVDGVQRSAVIEIDDPVLEGDTLTYAARIIDGSPPAAGGSTIVIIDWWSGPWDGTCHYDGVGGVRCD